MVALASDNFNRANSTGLGANWTKAGDASIFRFDVVSNAAVPESLAGADSMAYYNAVTWPNDQYSQAKITVTGTGGGGSGPGVAVRVGITGLNWYRAVVDHAGSNNVSLSIMVGGAYSDIWLRNATFTDGDVLRLEVQGTTLRVKINGVQVGGDVTDSTFSTGNAGLAYSTSESAATLDDWEGGDFSGGASPQTVTPNAIGTGESVFSPTVKQTVSPNAIGTAESVFAPTVNIAGGPQTVTPNAIGTGVVLFAPTLVGLQVRPNAIATVEQVYQPTISVGPAAGQVGPNAIPTAELVLGLSVFLRMLPNAIGTGASVPNPVVILGTQKAFATSVATGGRYLLDQFGQPYFTQGNSPQAMAVVGIFADIAAFFADQQTRGWNSSQVMLFCNNGIGGNADGSDVNGNFPFTNMSTWAGPYPSAYWSHIDSTFDLAEQYGVTLHVTIIDNISWGGSVNGISDANLTAFGQFVGNRYKARPNVIWVVGNDWQPFWGNEAKYEVMRQGVLSTGDTHLWTTWGSYPDSSSWENSTWDARHQLVYTYTYCLPWKVTDMAYRGTAMERGTSPATTPQPLIFSEGNYEGERNHPEFGQSGTTAADTLRRTAWWPVTYGSPGHFFGQSTVWRFVGWNGSGANQVGSPAAQQLARVLPLVTSLPNWQRLVPDTANTLITSGAGTSYTDSAYISAIGTAPGAPGNLLDPLNNDYATASITPDHLLAIVYVPTVRSWTLNTGVLNGTISGFWFDPTTGTQTAATAPWTIPATAHGDGSHDWVLVLQGSGTQTVTPNTIATAAAVYGPQVALFQTAFPAAIGTAESVFSPTASVGVLPQTVTAGTIATAEQVYQPTVTMGSVAGQVQPNLIPSAEQVYAPALSVQILPGTIATAASVFAPTVLRAVAQTVTPDAIGTAEQVYAPLVGVPAQTVTTGTILSAARVHPPLVRVHPRFSVPPLEPLPPGGVPTLGRSPATSSTPVLRPVP